jgi:hypothetical protein
MRDPGIFELVQNAKVEAEFFYAAFPDVSRRDIEKMQRLSNAVSAMLDSAS